MVITIYKTSQFFSVFKKPSRLRKVALSLGNLDLDTQILVTVLFGLSPFAELWRFLERSNLATITRTLVWPMVWLFERFGIVFFIQIMYKKRGGSKNLNYYKQKNEEEWINYDSVLFCAPNKCGWCRLFTFIVWFLFCLCVTLYMMHWPFRARPLRQIPVAVSKCSASIRPSALTDGHPWRWSP